MTASSLRTPIVEAVHHEIASVSAPGDLPDPAAVERLLDEAASVDGRYPLSDHLRLELSHGGGPGFAAVTVAEGDELAGYAQLATINGTRNIELVVAPPRRGDASIARRLLTTAVDLVARDGGGPVQWWAFDATPADEHLAASAGLTMTRELLQMRRPLPTGLPVEVMTRPFVPGQDEDAFLSVNNRAFATHPEQGGWTLDTLHQREREPWFDPAGFLLHERDGRLAAFCWTKIHARGASPPVDPPGGDGPGEAAEMGEIYVIAVDPDFQGLGLGRQLTLAGLASIAERNVDVGMLYVDGGNTGAVTMYEHLGFVVHRTDRAFTAAVEASA